MTEAPASAPGRQVVVLRAGPPKGRGAWIDAVVGILGVGLLVLAAVLGAVLPEEEIPPRQFKVSYPQGGHEAQLCCAEGQDPGLSVRETDVVPEGEVREYEIVVEHDNAFQFQVTFGATHLRRGDDIQSSDPDSFRIELYAPDGTFVGPELTLETKRPRLNDEEGSTRLYISEPVETSGSMRFGAKPGTEFVAVNDTSVTKAEVLREISANKTLATKGTWTLRVEVVQAGDCPEPGTDPAVTQRALACRQENDGNTEDPGNPYTIQKVRYDFYTIEVLSPEEQAGGS